MKTIFGLSNFKKKLKNTVVVIGVFDGLHRGHQYLIKNAVSTARALHKRPACITFHPHPQGQPYLISLKHRLKIIEELGVDYCLVISFSRQFSKITAQNFVKDILVKLFHPLFIFVGDDFRFGYKADGNVKLLKSLEENSGFKVRPVKKMRIGRKIISSKRIRRLIITGKLTEAEKLLGRKVSVLGTVIEGLKRGRILGYPTANINPHHEVLPKEGVYAVSVLYKKIKYNGLCNIGRRPTFSRPDEALAIEVHLFNFKKSIYGKDIEIQFIRKLRNEKKFPSSPSLISQINEDQQKALAYLSR